jgi:MoxR-like ATPase
MGYPSRSAELEIYSGGSRRRLLETQKPLISTYDFVSYQQQVELIQSTTYVLEYLYELIQFTRQSNLFVNGVSTRGGLAVLHAAKAWAWLDGESVLLPQHIKAVFTAVVGHRLQAKEGGLSPETMGDRVLAEVKIPR